VAALALFKVENLIYYYPGTVKPALAGVSLEIEDGEFVLVTGGSGSGKSSLARALAGLLPDFYGGRFGGRVSFRGRDLRTLDRRALAREVGMVFQDPEKQLVMTGVEAEVAFGLENLGLSQEEMRRRVAEVVGFLGLTGLREKFTANLSGGEKQRLALAAVLAMRPQVLILDEPTSQLDPAAAEEFLNLVRRLNEEMGFTVVLIEQRLERCFHLSDRVLLMEEGRILRDGTPQQVARWAVARENPFVPPVSRFFAQVGFPAVAVTVKEGRRLLRPYRVNRELPDGKPADAVSPGRGASGKLVVEAKGLGFTYPDGREALWGINCTFAAGEFVAVMGENGAGKSTLLKILAGLLRPGRGKAVVLGSDLEKNNRLGPRVAYLSQNPNDYLFQETVEEELRFGLKNFGLPDNGIVDKLLTRLHLGRYRKMNPRDLSSGERQRVALAAVLVTRPALLLLDEPTRGMDYRLKAELGTFLKELAAKGVTVVLVTHDVEFTAEYAARVVLLSAGRLVSDGPKHRVLGTSVFYAPQMARLCRGLADNVLTVPEAVKKIGALLRCSLPVQAAASPPGDRP